MNVPRAPHRWSVTPRQAVAIQRRLAPLVRSTRPDNPLRFVAGADLAFDSGGRTCIAAVVLWDAREGEVVEQHVVKRTVTFPYVPGLLSFRETPAIMAALRKLAHKPDAVMCDGQGLAHPRRFGLACHVGVIIDLPTLGCAKSRLTGDHNTVAAIRGSRTSLMDGGEVIGTVLTTRDGVKPVFVSIGHRIDLHSAAELVLRCAPNYRVPEPTRRADQLVTRARNSAGPGG